MLPLNCAKEVPAHSAIRTSVAARQSKTLDSHPSATPFLFAHPDNVESPIAVTELPWQRSTDRNRPDSPPATFESLTVEKTFSRTCGRKVPPFFKSCQAKFWMHADCAVILRARSCEAQCTDCTARCGVLARSTFGDGKFASVERTRCRGSVTAEYPSATLSIPAESRSALNR